MATRFNESEIRLLSGSALIGIGLFLSGWGVALLWGWGGILASSGVILLLAGIRIFTFSK